MPPGNAPLPCAQRSRNTSTRWECLGVITHVDVSTDWVSSITYIQKANGKLYLCLESPWHQWGHPLRSSQDAHCGGSHSPVCTLSLLHQVGCPPMDTGQLSSTRSPACLWLSTVLQKISFPATSVWPGLFPRHLPEEDGPDPQRVPRMHWNHRQHHHPQLHRGGTWCPPMKPHVDCLQIQSGI